MVNTRGQRPAAIVAASPAIGIENTIDASALLDTPNASKEVSRADGANGGRLRKRRRSASPPDEVTEPISKRSSLRKLPSLSTKRTSVLAPASKDLREDTGANLTRKTRGVKTEVPNTTPHAGETTNNGAAASVPQNRGRSTAPKGSAQSVDLQGSSDTGPDLQAVMTRIIDHGESVDNQYAAHGEHPSDMLEAEGLLSLGATVQLKIQSLPILDNLAVQILTTFANSTPQEIQALTTQSGSSESSTAYATLKSLFDHTKKVYTIHDPFLSPQHLGLIENGQVEVIRKANFATFVSSVFGSQDVGFYHLDEHFLETFVADGGRLLKNQAGLFLDLKTQAYISAITNSNGDRSREEVLRDLFPQDLEERLLSRRHGAKQLAPSEADFVQRANNRKKTLLEEHLTQEAIEQLPVKYVWEDFLRDISGYVSKNFQAIVGSPTKKSHGHGRSTSLFFPDQLQSQKKQRATKNQPAQNSLEDPNATPYPAEAFNAEIAQMIPQDTHDDVAAKAARAADFVMQGLVMNQDTSGPSQGDPHDDPQQASQQQYPYQFEQQATPYYTNQTNHFANNSHHLQQQIQQQQTVDMPTPQHSYPDPNTIIPYPTQTAPTQVLYERARQAATAKASPSNRRAGHPSQRRPWTTEEENSLMSGLDRVKGPHWSQILAMYGPGGTLNESLKDRNQVQLKDKARNLKLFFLKSGIEVPYYLQFVTGELKTRAPQAARMEARSKRESVNNDAAKLEGAEGEAEPPRSQDGEQAVGGGVEDQDAAMEDGEGEIIDPAEYAAVHGAGNHGLPSLHPEHSTNAQQQLFEAATEQAIGAGRFHGGGHSMDMDPPPAVPPGMGRGAAQVAVMMPTGNETS